MGRLAPSGQAFLPELSLIAQNAVAVATLLRDRLDSAIGHSEYQAEFAAYARETEALAAVVTTGVPRTLVPPIDGDDATALVSRLRIVVEGMHRLARLVDAVGPNLPDAMASYLADLLVQATDSVEGAAATMTRRNGALDFGSDVRRSVREGDLIYTEAMGAMFAATSDPLEAVRQAAVYGSLRESLRDCAAAVAVIERIVLKRF